MRGFDHKRPSTTALAVLKWDLYRHLGCNAVLGGRVAPLDAMPSMLRQGSRSVAAHLPISHAAVRPSAAFPSVRCSSLRPMPLGPGPQLLGSRALCLGPRPASKACGVPLVSRLPAAALATSPGLGRLLGWLPPFDTDIFTATLSALGKLLVICVAVAWLQRSQRIPGNTAMVLSQVRPRLARACVSLGRRRSWVDESCMHGAFDSPPMRVVGPAHGDRRALSPSGASLGRSRSLTQWEHCTPSFAAFPCLVPSHPPPPSTSCSCLFSCSSRA